MPRQPLKHRRCRLETASPKCDETLDASSAAAAGGPAPESSAQADSSEAERPALETIEADDELVRRCVAGDVAAWEQLYARCQPALLADIQRLLGQTRANLELVDELAAQVWLPRHGYDAWSQCVSNANDGLAQINEGMVVKTITGVAPGIVVVLIARELLVTTLRSISESGGKDFSAAWSGKDASLSGPIVDRIDRYFDGLAVDHVVSDNVQGGYLALGPGVWSDVRAHAWLSLGMLYQECAGGQRALVRGAINAQCQPADDGQAAPGQRLGNLAGGATGRLRRLSRPNDRDRCGILRQERAAQE